VNNLSACYGPRSYIIVFATARHYTQMNTVHAIMHSFFEIRFNIILPSTSTFTKWCFWWFLFRLSDWIIYCTHFSFLPCVLHTQPLSSNNICWRIQVMKLLVKQLSPVCCFLPVTSKYPPQVPSVCIVSLIWKVEFHTHAKRQVQL